MEKYLRKGLLNRMLILNEKKEAELILNDINSTECGIMQIINLLIRYNMQYKNMNKELSIAATSEYVKNHFKGYIYSNWISYMESVAKSSKKNPLRDIDSIPITQKELDDINIIENNRLRKVAFTCLVAAKMNFITKGHKWVNISKDQILRLSNVKKVGKSKGKEFLFNDLYQMEYISFPKRIDRVNYKYEKIDEDGVSILEVKHISDLGYWLDFANGEKFNICEECGRLYKPRSSNQRYCFIHSAIYNKPLTCICIDCGREFQIEPGQIKRKRCECCYMEHKTKYFRNKRREYREKEKKCST